MGDRKIFVIEQGSYSDYRVVGVYSTRANAERVLAAIKESSYDDASIDEWPLDPGADELAQGLGQWSFQMHRNGDVERCDAVEKASGYNILGEVSIWPRSKAPAYKGMGLDDLLTGTIWAKDKTHAIKIANEKRLELIATDKWPAHVR